MAVYVDEMVSYPGKGRWCHMVADDPEELHRMAARIGLRREWFQNHSRHPHYDLMYIARTIAVQNGAIEVNRRELVKILKRQQDR